jgi:tetratricopeptide (TPR) repeat protein
VSAPSFPGFLHRLRPWQRWVLVVALLMVVLVVVLRRPLADHLWPEARAQALREQAGLALKHGRLTAADGSGARELYEAALAIDPDRNDARIGLMRVAEAALAQARAATRVDDYAQAHQALQLAQELSVPRGQSDAVAAQLRQREAAHAGIGHLLARAAAARAAHRLDGGDDAALPLYQRVLALQPDRVEALEGREDALSDLLQQARHALQDDDIGTAAHLVAAARGYDPGHADLPDAEARLAAAIDRARRLAEQDARRGRLEQAAARYRVLLQVDPADAAAQRGVERIAQAWSHRAARLAADFRFDDAGAALARAKALSPDAPALRDAERAIAHAHQAQARLHPSMPRAQRDRRVRTLLAQAEAALARGDLLTPPGDSAFDKLRAARALSPDDPGVRRAGARLLPVARACFERELRANSLARARACLDARVALEGDSQAAAHARRRLAQRWLAVGEERLRAGALRPAQEALASARAVDATVPGLDDFAARLATASASAH